MSKIKTSFEWAVGALPKRSNNSNKGSFGRALLYVGSEKYMGAAHLAAESALRGGAGYVELFAQGELKGGLLQKFPEALYYPFPEAKDLRMTDVEQFAIKSRSASSILVGCGLGKSDALVSLAISLISQRGGILILDADALNSMSESREECLQALKSAQRQVILTPHPLEFSRLSGLSVEYINQNREECAREFARFYNCILVLKGNETVITDGKETYVNTSGSSALAKAGSGDALAGLIASLMAAPHTESLALAALGVYVHGLAADRLSNVYSEYGVTPSDLPREMAKVLSDISKAQKS